MAYRKTVRGILKLLRLPYWLMTGGLSLLTFLALKPANLNVETFVLTFFSMAFISSAGFAINDFFDKDGDALVKPSRPIPAGEIPPKVAVYVSAVFFLLGLLQAFLLNWLCLLIVFIDSILLVVYSAFIKRRSGFAANILVGGLIGTAFLYGEAAGSGTITTASLSMYPICLGSVGGNILRDILSLEGDCKLGYPTLPQKLGVGRSAKVAALFFICCTLSAPLPYLLGIFSEKYLALILIWCLILIYGSVSLLRAPSSLDIVKRNERILTMSMILLPLALITEVIS
ncbi:MAG: UbiA family prenyltransferase [Candidatus Bathyarchaeia archaeon]